MPIAVGSSHAGGRWRLSRAFLNLSPSALRWWAGSFCAFLGAFIVVAPQEFAGVAYRTLRVQSLGWGLMFVVAGGCLLTAAAMRPGPRAAFVAHALAAGALAFFGGRFAGAGAWTGALVYSLLAAGVFAVGLLPQRPPPTGERRRGDAMALLLGLVAVVLGLQLIVLAESLPSEIYTGEAATHRLLGAMLVLTGPFLVWVQLWPGTRRSLTWIAHVGVACAFAALALKMSLPARTWTGVVLYGSAALTIASLPWLRRRLQQFDPASLATRLALSSALSTSIGLLMLVALLQSGSEREAEVVAAESQRLEAVSVARNVVDYLELIGARSEALAGTAGDEPWAPAPQEALISRAARDKERIAGIGVYAVDGSPLAVTGRRTIERLWVMRLLQEQAAGALGVSAVRLFPSGGESLLLAASPVRDPSAEVRGLLVTGYDPGAVLWRLSGPGLSVRLVDEGGRVVATQHRGEEIQAGEPRIRATAPVPGLGWRVVVERPLAAALASVRRERVLAFGLLVLAVLAAVLAGTLVARAIAAPLRRLAAAADQLAAGNPDVPLATSGVSEIDRLSANFRDMRERLEARTRERERLAAELHERAEALAEADHRKDEFLAMLAHELRNPLGAISNAAHLLGQLTDPDPRVTRSVAVIRRQMKHLVRLVDDLLDVARITRGKLDLQRSPLDLADVVHRTVEGLQPLIEARHHRLLLTLTDEPLPMVADATRLDQVVGNLLRNASLYTEPGGNLAVTTFRDGGRAVVQVSDDGIGIGEDLLPRVFEIFTQGRQSLDRAGGGLGIGLTLVRQLVELHGGEVRAMSDGPGRGSTFEVRLPLKMDDGSGVSGADLPTTPGAGPTALEPSGDRVADLGSDSRGTA
ncbi:MAG TPA: sensor histidine kinase [Thermoanaerobaculia bacterium]|nr:sensor histidine kinase [Thermoanaerobaculia bacterium]